MRLRYLAALLVACALAPAYAAPAKPVTLRTWTLGDKVNTFSFGKITLSFGEGHDRDGADVPAFQIKSPGAAPYTVAGQSGTNPVTAKWAVLQLDKGNPLPQIVFTSYSGGAHCCTRIYIVEKMASGWTAFDLGLWEGDGLTSISDVDGDGTYDIVEFDNRFLYTFDDSAVSWSPPVVMNVRNGAVQDVSKQPRYKKFYESWAAKAKAACAKHSNGACAAYAADAARAGDFAEAWKFVLANYDHNAHWDLPGRCAGKMAGGKCNGKQIKPRDFPESLRWFLEDHDYISRQKAANPHK
jgi:hypothetical protein